MFPDANASFRRRDDQPVHQVNYGRVEDIFHVELDDHGDPDAARTFLLARVTPCDISDNDDATEELVEYKNMSRQLLIVHLSSIEAAVGRIKRYNTWSIVDRSRGAVRTLFMDDNNAPFDAFENYNVRGSKQTIGYTTKSSRLWLNKNRKQTATQSAAVCEKADLGGGRVWHTSLPAPTRDASSLLFSSSQFQPPLPLILYQRTFALNRLCAYYMRQSSTVWLGSDPLMNIGFSTSGLLYIYNPSDIIPEVDFPLRKADDPLHKVECPLWKAAHPLVSGLSADENCSGRSAGGITQPGFNNLADVGMNDAMSTFVCFG
ncbi:hypothetical protein BDV93DRAFT_546050 [Ceratobasidium sp. AG-I]|nr:hypothetical protein BDV93DRAFT_546050 [Ceratobasidium sp. AG-I]